MYIYNGLLLFVIGLRGIISYTEHKTKRQNTFYILLCDKQ